VRTRHRLGAALLDHFGMGVEHLEMRSDADRLLQVGVDPTELLGGAVISGNVDMNSAKGASVEAMLRDLRAAVDDRGGHADAADQLHQRRQAG
jgi:hypothetical protein